MARKLRVIEFTAKRKVDGRVGGELFINYECTREERIEALSSLVNAVCTVADHWDMEPQLLAVARSIIAGAVRPATKPKADDAEGA